MESNEKRPLMADPEQLAVPPAFQAELARADRRRRVAFRVKLVAIAVALFFVFSSSSRFGLTALLSSIIPALERPGPSSPGSSPSAPSSPGTDSPLTYKTPLDGPIALPNDWLCRDYNGGNGLKSYPAATYPLVFDAQHPFAFRQNASEHEHERHGQHYRHVRVLGEVVVRRTAGNEPSVVVEAVSNDDRIRTLYDFVEDNQSLQVTVDDRIWAEEVPARGHPCLVVRATVWLPDGDSNHLGNLVIANTHLGIQLIDDTNLVVDHVAQLVSISGGITASRPISDETDRKNPDPVYRFEAPSTDVKTVSGHIAGPWTLRDRLHFDSVSGDIDVAVASFESDSDSDSDSDKIADLSFRTVSGSVRFKETPSEANPHTLAVTTRSGDVDAVGSFVNSARLQTTSGHIQADLTVEPSDETILNTNTVSGATEVTIKSAEKLHAMKSVHKSVSGTVQLHYPESWAGEIFLKSVSSRLGVTGKGVRVEPGRPRWPPGRTHNILEATKDVVEEKKHELSRITGESVSGSVWLDFPL